MAWVGAGLGADAWRLPQVGWEWVLSRSYPGAGYQLGKAKTRTGLIFSMMRSSVPFCSAGAKPP